MRSGFSRLRRSMLGSIGLLAAAGGASPAALASQPGADAVAYSASYEGFAIRTHRGIEWFQLADADRAATAAWRDPSELADKSGNVPSPLGGYVVSAIVSCRSPAELPLAEFAARTPGCSYDSSDGAPGFWVVTLPTAREAISAANTLAADTRLSDVGVDIGTPFELRTVPSDPRFVEQWHMRNDLAPLFDANLEPVWTAGYTGTGVVVGIVEGSWQRDHPDLAGNFNAAATLGTAGTSSHATGTAGIVGAVGNNALYGAGAAYGAQISNQVIAASDQSKADALAYRNDLNHIKSNSWGPSDNGVATYLPAVVRTAIETAASTGRGGKGEIFVWAGGNGHAANDRTDYDPYVSSRQVIGVGAIGDHDLRSSYSETGSSLMIVAQSDGGARDIYTTTSGGGETFSFGGTSAACPLVAGTVALLLEANPDLTWRDVQHVLIRSARKNNPTDPGWVVNGADRDVNYQYGFGAIDGGAAMVEALGWHTAAADTELDSGLINVASAVPDNNPVGISRTYTFPTDLRIETVELIMNITTNFVGDLKISMSSPAGTESIVAMPRGDSQDNYVNYRFLSRRHWDERAEGTWTVTVADMQAGASATWGSFRLVAHGSAVCDGDIDLNFIVDLADLATLLSKFGSCDGDGIYDRAADVDRSGCVDLPDLATLLVAFGAPCP